MQAVQQILTDDMIRYNAPSAFADHAHGSRSGRYAFIPTSKVISAMRAEGFMPVFASQSRCRTPDREGYAKHMLRFRRESTLDIEARAIGDVSAEVVLVNSHDGSTLYHLMAGLFRLWCLNGAVSQIGTDTDLKVAHTGKAIDALIEGSYKVIESARVALDHAKYWNRIQLSAAEVDEFATAAARLRFDPETQPVRPGQLVAPRREQDTGNDLWDRVQPCAGRLDPWRTAVHHGHATAQHHACGHRHRPEHQTESRPVDVGRGGGTTESRVTGMARRMSDAPISPGAMPQK